MAIADPNAKLTIQVVQTKADLEVFINLPKQIYRGTPRWVPRLYQERLEHFSTTKNPFFEHGKWQAWLAFRGNQPVGRISAQIDELHEKQHQNATGHFGSIEFIDDAAVPRALFAVAESWLRHEGMKCITGPMNLNINQEVGLLVDGFNEPPRFMMGYAHPYFSQHFKDCGYQKAIDTFTFQNKQPKGVGKVFDKIHKRRWAIQTMASNRLKLRLLDTNNLESEFNLICELFNNAWSDNWGFVPFTEKEISAIGRSLLKIATPGWAHIAEYDGKPAAFIVIIPDLNDAIRDLNGKLLPFGWLKLLWRLKVKGIRTSRVPLMGVRKKYQASLTGFLMISHLLKRAAEQYQVNDDFTLDCVEASWVLENNKKMIAMLRFMGFHKHKTYRIYEKQL